MRSGVDMFVVGLGTACVGYLVGKVIEHFFFGIKYMHRLLFILVTIFIFANLGCDKSTPDTVVATTGMITDVVKNVGGENIKVFGMMGPGVDPHLYKPTKKDIQRLNSAHIIFYNGLHLEGKLGDVLAKMSGDTKSVAVTDDIDKELLLSSQDYEGEYDPHLWFDVRLWIKAVEKVRDTLIEFDTDNEETYKSNAERYLTLLTQLHQYVKTQAERIPSEQRVLVTAHDAFNYFGEAYGFEVRGLQGISTVSEAAISDVQELAAFIAERRIPAIFVESSVSSRSLEAVKAAVKSKGFDVQIGGELFSDAMGHEGTPEGTYIGMVKHNIDTIVIALIGKTTPSKDE